MPVVRKIVLEYSVHMKFTCVFIAGCLLCPSVWADTAFPDGLQVGVGASLTGGIHLMTGYYNPDLPTYFGAHFGTRVGFASTDPLKSAIDSAIDSVMHNGVDVGDMRGYSAA